MSGKSLAGTGVPGRSFNVALGFVAAAAVVGFFTGTWESKSGADAAKEPEAHTGRAEPQAAPVYAEVPRLQRSAPRGESRLSDLMPDEPVAVVNDTGAPRTGLLEKRRTRRAYAAAPPLIPHKVSQRAAPNCRTCHETGLTVGGLRAPVPGHAMMANCTQCHVQSSVPSGLAGLPLAGEPVHNVFAGNGEPESGPRAWAGAPPTIPHPIFMRQNCMACHGPEGRPGIRTSHPQRGQCVQCHVNQDNRDRPPPAF